MYMFWLYLTEPPTANIFWKGIYSILTYCEGFPGGSRVKILPAMQEPQMLWVQSRFNQNLVKELRYPTSCVGSHNPPPKIFQNNLYKLILLLPFYSLCPNSHHSAFRKHKSTHCCCCQVTSVVSDSVQPHRLQPTKLPHPWDSPGKNTGVGCHFPLQCMKVKSEKLLSRV